MTDPVDDLKSLVRETEREARELLVAGRCWLFHRWTKWTLADDTGAQHRQCVRCGLAQRVGGKVLCSHRWSTLRVTKVFGNENDKVPIYDRYTLRCDNCGDIKVYNASQHK